jgi:broad specificity phosphatase PhoE
MSNQYKLEKYIRLYKATNEMRYLDKVMYYLKGGNPPLNILIVTHNSRMRCLLKDWLGVNNIPEFLNCAIIKLTITQNLSSIELIYPGSTESTKKHDLVKKQKEQKELEFFFKVNQVSMNENLKKKINFNQVNMNNEMNFYIMRHAEGTHNIVTTLGKLGNTHLLDPHLTSNGIQQAMTAGEKFSKEIKFDYLFASKLHRTRETLVNFMKGTKPVAITTQPFKNTTQLPEIIILPCSHELAYNDMLGSNCDNPIYKFGPTALAYENNSKCEKEKKDNTCTTITLDNITYPINWEHYTQSDCTKTNMITQCIEIIKKLESKKPKK